MHIALVLRTLLNIRPKKMSRLPTDSRQRLEGQLLTLVATNPKLYSLHVPVDLGLASTLRDFFQLYAAIHFLYHGRETEIFVTGPGSNLVSSQVHWLKVTHEKRPKTITISPEGNLNINLPPLPQVLCTSHRQKSYNTTPQLLEWLIKRIWGFSGLREGQLEIIQRLLSGKNTLGILPTGAGKSLCFQLPALLLPGITLVVSPLKSLMRDQVSNLHRAGITGMDFIDSSKTAREKARIFSRLRQGQLKLLYLSPERLQIQSFQQELAATLSEFPVSLFAIDEAHCISEWGHDFRPSYLRLRHFISELSLPPICALTATASHYVRQDILTLLGLNTQDMVTPQSLDRREISLQVKILPREDEIHQHLKSTLQEIPQILAQDDLNSVHQAGAGVVFTPYAKPRGLHTRKLGTEYLVQKIQELGLNCHNYHSQMPDNLRMEIQDRFKDNSFPLLVATKGYGMGIDKENIDYIIHSCAPASLEAYYQEAGRAGRDGQHAHSVILTKPRHSKCQDQENGLPSCHQGWSCTITGKAKCDFGVQAGMLAQEYPGEAEIITRFNQFLQSLIDLSRQGLKFTYLCSDSDSKRHLKYLYYLQQFGAVTDFRVIEYRMVGKNQFNLLLYVELTTQDSLEANQYWLANKVVERVQTYKRQKLNMLTTMQSYIKTKTCRRRFLMQYFGDDTRYQQCNFCDVDGISPQARPMTQNVMGEKELLAQVNSILLAQDYLEAMDIVGSISTLDLEDDIKIRAMRELEDRPDNPAALLFAGWFSLHDPETKAYGMRNLQGVMETILNLGNDPMPLFSLLASHPQDSYSLACTFLEQLGTKTLQELATGLTPASEYPDIHLALHLPQLLRANSLLKGGSRHESSQ